MVKYQEEKIDFLLKTISCYSYHDSSCSLGCEKCPYYQTKYEEPINNINIFIKSFNQLQHEIKSLQKSNRNWRRKAQRLRKEIKKMKEKENV